MKLLAVSIGHDASITILNDGKIELYLAASRISRRKHDWNAIKCLDHLIATNNTTFDSIVVDFFKLIHYNLQKEIQQAFKHFTCDDIKYTHERHHLYHAYSGYYHSSFDDALCIVLDGAGAEFDDGTRETESVYHINNHTFTPVCTSTSHDVSQTNGHKFVNISQYCGFGEWGAGKVMGLAPYTHLPTIEQVKIDACKYVQQDCEQHTIDLINQYKHLSNNIIISGGYALNCVANTRFKHTFPEHNIQIDPTCSDDGISIGLAYYYTQDNVQRLQSLYIGTPFNPPITNSTTYHDVAQLLSQGHVIGMCQGQSEAGKRALGNRSLLFDPRLSHEQINSIKGREHWRPFAGTVLKEYANQWFDVDNSPYMQYTVNVKTNSIPAITHVNNTCRVQTVDQQQNYHFYHLINAFNDITSIPILGNTSFNYAGEDIAETYQQALDTAHKMNIQYLFVPDVMGLVIL